MLGKMEAQGSEGLYAFEACSMGNNSRQTTRCSAVRGVNNWANEKRGNTDAAPPTISYELLKRAEKFRKHKVVCLKFNM